MRATKSGPSRSEGPPRIAIGVCALFILSGVLTWTNLARGDGGLAIDIVGTLRVRAEHFQKGDQITVRGIVDDELGRPIAGADIECLGLRAVSCDSEVARVQTDGAGQFCLTARSVEPKIALQVVHSGYDRLELTLSPTELQGKAEIVYAPRTIDLDSVRPESLLVRYPKVPVRDLELIIVSQSGLHPVTRAVAEPSGQSELSVAPSTLPEPGKFVWIVRQGTEQSAPWAALARASVLVELRSREEQRGETQLTLGLRAHGQVVESGRVEAEFCGALLSSEVHAGQARLRVPKSEQPDEVRITYVPLAPEYLAGEPLRVAIPGKRPLVPGWCVHVLLTIFFLVWFAKRWAFRRSHRSAPLLSPLEGIEPAPQTSKPSGIDGIVRDAHTGEPISLAVVSVVRLGVLAEESVLAARTDAGGTFSLAWPARTDGTYALTVEKSGYRTLRGPSGGKTLNIRVAERRRALLGDLLVWARRADSPWTLTRAPTPLEVAVLARDHGLNDTSEWALRIHREAFGPEAVAEAGPEPNSSR